ncbi:MAG: hypothetical protein V1875_03830 [Candidatus Altiarchaeota archaeon]
MKRVLVLLVAAGLGCLCGTQDQATTTTTIMETTSTTLETTTSSTSTTLEAAPPTSSTLPDLPECQMLGATFWRALCYDDAAYSLGEPGLCRTVFCKAKFGGAGVCGSLDLQTNDWVAYQRIACEGWANGSFSDCRFSLNRNGCIRWYALIANNFTLCDSAEATVRDNCAWEFAYWRGNASHCDRYNTNAKLYECRSYFFDMLSTDRKDPEFCRDIMIPKLAGDCRETANWTGPEEKHPLFGAFRQLTGWDDIKTAKL